MEMLRGQQALDALIEEDGKPIGTLVYVIERMKQQRKRILI